jgi:hypothetical protein
LTVLQLPGGEVQPAMKTGLIDGAEFNNPSMDKNFGMQDVAKFYHLGSFHQPAEMFEIVFNKKKFQSLSPTHRNILRIAAEAANTDNYYKALKLYGDELASLVKDSGVKVVKTPADILAAQMKSWDKVIGEFEAKDPLFKEIIQNKGKIFPITNPESTRFLITLNEGVKFVIQSLTLMNGREIFIPKMKSFKIISLAKTLLKTCKFKIIGLRPGEKLHEILFSKDESNNVIEFKKYYVLLPSSMINQKTLINKFKEKGIKLKYGFDYSSKNTSNDKFLKDKISP